MTAAAVQHVQVQQLLHVQHTAMSTGWWFSPSRVGGVWLLTARQRATYTGIQCPSDDEA